MLKDSDAILTRMYCNVCDYSTSLFPLPDNQDIQNTTDLVPPYAHACLYQLNLLVNDAFCKAANDANVILEVDAEFNWMMHTAIMKIGSNDGFNG